MNWQIIILISISVIIGSFGALLLKRGSKHFNIPYNFKGIIHLLKNYELILGLGMYGISSIFFIYALRLDELSLIYPLTSLSYVCVSLLSVYFLKEKMNVYKWMGIGFILIGVILIT